MSFKNNHDGVRDEALRLPDHLIEKVLSYCDASDFIRTLRASQSFFETPLQLHLQSTSSLQLSFLLKDYPNRFGNDNNQHEIAVELLLNFILPKASASNILKHLEFSNLRGITGKRWLPKLCQIPLVSLDFTNCVHMNPEILCEHLRTCLKTLRHLNLTGCSRVGDMVLSTIWQFHSQLESISLASCSQSITLDAVSSMLQYLKRLKHLNLQNLSHLFKSRRLHQLQQRHAFADVLPVALKSINLSEIQEHFLWYDGTTEAVTRYNERSTEFHDDPEINHTYTNAKEEYIWKDVQPCHIHLEHMVLEEGWLLGRGTVAYFSLGKCLREVHLSGVGVSDWEIECLAWNCADTLTCFQMRGSRINDIELVALGKYCRVLAEVDVSACERITDAGIEALCQDNSAMTRQTRNCLTKRRKTSHHTLKVLKVACLTRLTNNALKWISKVESLTILDVSGCVGLTAPALHETVRQLPHLIDVNAKNICHSSPSLPALLRKDELTPKTLRFVNLRLFCSSTSTEPGLACCSVRSFSQRLTPYVPLQSMYHCIDCNLMPSTDRGMCGSCMQRCHKGHNIFLGSYTRFYCDCPFGVAANNICQAINPLSKAPFATIEAG